MDAAKLAKSSFLQFQYKTYFIVTTTNSQLFCLLCINWTLPGKKGKAIPVPGHGGP
jgi:hypothetical protein